MRLSDLSKSFRPQPREVYESEPVNLPPPREELPFRFVINTGPVDIVEVYKREACAVERDKHFKRTRFHGRRHGQA